MKVPTSTDSLKPSKILLDKEVHSRTDNDQTKAKNPPIDPGVRRQAPKTGFNHRTARCSSPAQKPPYPVPERNTPAQVEEYREAGKDLPNLPFGIDRV